MGGRIAVSFVMALDAAPATADVYRLVIFALRCPAPYEPAMPHTIHDKKKLLARVRRIKGQVQSLEAALEDEKECAAVLQQIAAVRGAVSGLMAEVLEGHLREHLGADDVSPAQRQSDLEEVVSALRSYLK